MGSKGLFGKGLSGRGLFRAASGAIATLALSAVMSVPALAGDTMGLPTDKAMGWQPAGSALKRQTEVFYNYGLFPLIVAICVLVGVLLLWIMIRYNRKANPIPAKFSHNTFIEIVWTLIPVVILVVVAVFSLGLLRDYNDMPKPDVVVKATGNQWFWTYDYPELGVTDIESRLREDAKDIKTAKAAGVPYLLEVDNALVVPVNKVVHVQVTGADVIHSFTIPAFGFKIDAVPGRLNNTWFKAEKIGTYYGQCSELCGKDHAYMPIEIKVVSDADFDAFIIAQGGKTRAMLASEAAASAAAAEEAAASAAEAASASAAADVSAAASDANTTAPAAPASGAAAAH